MASGSRFKQYATAKVYAGSSIGQRAACSDWDVKREHVGRSKGPPMTFQVISSEVFGVRLCWALNGCLCVLLGVGSDRWLYRLLGGTRVKKCQQMSTSVYVAKRSSLLIYFFCLRCTQTSVSWTQLLLECLSEVKPKPTLTSCWICFNFREKSFMKMLYM